MQEKPTKEIIDQFFKDGYKDSTAIKYQPQIDRPELYQYEEQIGKQLFDMNSEELFDMITSFDRKRQLEKNSYGLSYRSYDQIASLFRALWNYYIEVVVPDKPIINPWNSKQMRGRAIMERISATKEAFTKEKFDNVIFRIQTEFSPDNYLREYLECLLRLFFDGIAYPQEIMSFTEDMIDLKTNEIHLPRTTVHISERTAELVQIVHEYKTVNTWRKELVAYSYHGSYFKLPMMPGKEDGLGGENAEAEFQAMTLVEVGAIVVRRLSMTARNKLKLDINYRTVYLLGFYEFIKGKVGEQRAKELLLSQKVGEDTHELMSYAKEYGVVAKNPTYLKKILRPFV